jgi:hypothetical protein
MVSHQLDTGHRGGVLRRATCNEGKVMFEDNIEIT